MEWTIAVKFVLSDQAPREHIGPRRWLVDIIAVENLSNGVIDEFTAQRREVEQDYQREDRGQRAYAAVASQVPGSGMAAPVPV